MEIKINNNNLDIIDIKLDTEVGNIILVKIYTRPGKIEKRGTWNDILRKIERNSNDNVIVAGDMNAHHTM